MHSQIFESQISSIPSSLSLGGEREEENRRDEEATRGGEEGQGRERASGEERERGEDKEAARGGLQDRQGDTSPGGEGEKRVKFFITLFCRSYRCQII